MRKLKGNFKIAEIADSTFSILSNSIQFLVFILHSIISKLRIREKEKRQSQQSRQSRQSRSSPFLIFPITMTFRSFFLTTLIVFDTYHAWHDKSQLQMKAYSTFYSYYTYYGTICKNAYYFEAWLKWFDKPKGRMNHHFA